MKVGIKRIAQALSSDSNETKLQGYQDVDRKAERYTVGAKGFWSTVKEGLLKLDHMEDAAISVADNAFDQVTVGLSKQFSIPEGKAQAFLDNASSGAVLGEKFLKAYQSNSVPSFISMISEEGGLDGVVAQFMASRKSNKKEAQTNPLDTVKLQLSSILQGVETLESKKDHPRVQELMVSLSSDLRDLVTDLQIGYDKIQSDLMTKEIE